jgi:hypothetical protein
VSTNELVELVERAGFVFKGRPVAGERRDVESETPARAVTFTVDEVLRSADALRGLAGSEVIVVTEDAAAIADAAELVMFTVCTSVGDRVVTEEIGHRDASRRSIDEVREATREVSERPLRERAKTAELVVVGTVTGARRVEEPGLPRSEHDPDWWLARVAVDEVIKGPNRKNVDVLFANSNDIAWYRAPKLHEGTRGILLLHRGEEDELPREAPARAYQATHPLDFHPVERRANLERALSADGRER